MPIGYEAFKITSKAIELSEENTYLSRALWLIYEMTHGQCTGLSGWKVHLSESAFLAVLFEDSLLQSCGWYGSFGILHSAFSTECIFKMSDQGLEVDLVCKHA